MSTFVPHTDPKTNTFFAVATFYDPKTKKVSLSGHTGLITIDTKKKILAGTVVNVEKVITEVEGAEEDQISWVVSNTLPEPKASPGRNPEFTPDLMAARLGTI